MLRALGNGGGIVRVGDSSRDNEGHAHAWGFGSRYRLVLDSTRLKCICCWETMLVKIAVCACLVSASLIAWEQAQLVSHKCRLTLMGLGDNSHPYTSASFPSGKPKENRPPQRKASRPSKGSSSSENPPAPAGENLGAYICWGPCSVGCWGRWQEGDCPGPRYAWYA